MKRLLLAIALIFLLAVPGAAEITWVGANQATIAWDAVTQTDNGTTIPEADAVSYNVYSKRLPDGTEGFADNTPGLQFTLTFTTEGRYITGVQTVRVPDGETDEQISTITWSDSEDAIAVPNQFGFVYYESPSNPIGLMPQS